MRQRGELWIYKQRSAAPSANERALAPRDVYSQRLCTRPGDTAYKTGVSRQRGESGIYKQRREVPSANERALAP